MHTPYTMTLNRCSLMFETENTLLMCRYVPVWGHRRAYNKFLNEFSEMFSSQSRSRIMDNSSLQISMYNRINNLLPALYFGLMFDCNPELEKYYKEKYGKEFKELADLNVIVSEMNRLRDKYRELFAAQQEKKAVIQTEVKINFENLIVQCENTLELSISRDIKVFQFKSYYDNTLKKVAK